LVVRQRLGEFKPHSRYYGREEEQIASTGSFGSGAGLKRFADFPVVSVRIHHAPEPPTIIIANRRHHLSAGYDRAVECRIRIINDHHHARSTAPERLRAVIFVFRGFVGDPEFGAVHGQARDDGLSVLTIHPE
jgi:hypothetical protein